MDTPVLTSIADRRLAIMANTPGIFIVQDDPNVKAAPKPWYELAMFEEVTGNERTIEHLAARYKLNPDFVKAVVFIESTHGWYDRFDPWNKTIPPMNVHDTLWHQLGVSRKELQDPARNVAAGVHILSAIWDRTQEVTVDRVATLYNQLGATEVNVYGRTVANFSTHKPWRQTKKT